MPEHSFLTYMEPFKIFGNVYFVGTKAVSSHLIDTGDGLILLDTGYPQALYLLLENIRKLGFSPYDIKILLHSHGHCDHIGGTARLAALTGAKTYIGALDKDMVTGKEDTSYANELGYVFNEAFTPDVLLQDGDEIQLGRTVIRAMHTPGHTPGTMSYFLDVTDGEKTCRAAMMGGSGTNTMEKPFLERYGISEKWRNNYPGVITRLEKEHVDIVLGNHIEDNDTLGRYLKMKQTGENTFIDNTAWPKHLAGCIRRYNTLLESEKE